MLFSRVFFILRTISLALGSNESPKDKHLDNIVLDHVENVEPQEKGNIEDNMDEIAITTLNFKVPADRLKPLTPDNEITLSWQLIREKSVADSKPIKKTTPLGDIKEMLQETLADWKRNKQGSGGIMIHLAGGPGAAASEQKADWKRWPVLLVPSYRGTGESGGIESAKFDYDRVEFNKWCEEHIEQLWPRDNARDIEAVKKYLLPETSVSFRVQSYGGWVVLSVLSFFPNNIDNVYSNTGFPDVNPKVSIEVKHERLYESARRANEEFYEAHPEMKHIVKDLVIFLSENPQTPPNPKPNPKPNHDTHSTRPRLTAKRFLSLGRALATGKDKEVHGLIWEMKREMDRVNIHEIPSFSEEMHNKFDALDGFQFAKRPLYALQIERIYAKKGEKSDWAATRVGQRTSGFEWVGEESKDMAKWVKDHKGTRILFSPEMVFASAFKDYPDLAPFERLKRKIEARSLLEEQVDMEQLKHNEIPIWVNLSKKDHIMPFESSMSTALTVGSVQSHVNNEQKHKTVLAGPDRWGDEDEQDKFTSLKGGRI